MTKDDCFNLGYITKHIGRNCILTFVLDVDEPLKYKSLESVFVELNNSLIPFYIKSIKINGAKAKVEIDGIDTIEKAEEIIKSSLFLPLSSLPPLSGKHFYFHELPGFTAIDKTYGKIGVVEEVLDYEPQAVFQINDGKNEILIPAEERFIVNINRESKELNLDTPEGLIDIYLIND